MRSHSLVAPTFLAGLLCASLPVQAPPQRLAVLVPMPATPAWQDFAFLAAVPAASAAAGGKPVVLAVGADGVLSPEVEDFLSRFHPARVVWIGGATDLPVVGGAQSERIAADAPDAVACALADRFFARCESAVLVRDGDYGSGLIAAALAARVRAPLFFCGATGLSDQAHAALERTGATSLLVVGESNETISNLGKQAIERLRGPSDVARWMQRHALPVHYVAAAAPSDRVGGHVRKLSLAAALLAAGRNGAVVTIGSDAAPPPDAASVQSSLAEFGSAIGALPDFLCIAGMPEAIPMAVVPSSGQGIDSDPPSDLVYGNVDSDPFLELAVGRIVSEDTPSGTLLAARSLVYEDLIAPAFAARFAMAEWESACEPLFTNVGFAPPSRHAGPKHFAPDSPLASVAVLVHNSHASWLRLGATYGHKSSVLLSPCLVESASCSAASIDQDEQHRSVALRLLRNGAIGFVGNVRSAPAEQQLFRSEFWNAVLAGKSLGQANRCARNRALVSVLANGEAEQGLRRYQLYNQALFGDPALVLHVPRAPKVAPARVEVRDRTVTAHAPAEWFRAEMFAPPDWKYTESPVIYTWRGPGVGVECSWDSAHKRNCDDLVFTVEVRTSSPVNSIVALDPPPAPLGWDGHHFIDEHPDGTRSVYFRIRMIDFDMTTGKILKQVNSLSFRLD